MISQVITIEPTLCGLQTLFITHSRMNVNSYTRLHDIYGADMRLHCFIRGVAK